MRSSSALFTGGEKSEQIKMWDVRARKTVDELATGNTGVASMAWDPKRSALYVATECIYMDRMGSHHDYRKARIPKWAHKNPIADTDGEDVSQGEGGEDEDFDDDDDDERYWPDRAYHGEDYFGYAFDAGEHRLCTSSCYASGLCMAVLTSLRQTDMPLRRILTQWPSLSMVKLACMTRIGDRKTMSVSVRWC